nr:immunoglobulin heavy chain junction region [Macaca mulatta]MOW76308.1 immunoglobulin heavy chain junction region [Macaca mulatta]MOW78344.1 immunoglobulin heavy chain junction region [Macaca mulatta]MOW81185.1 immunoglobulin heavy chain junction region [Macaca mulatta]MOW81199.1 immunoglobulin heavy chain junction region [Macaca mulatta]
CASDHPNFSYFDYW